MVKTSILFHVPDNADDCRKKLVEFYPNDKAKYRKMPARQIKAIYTSVMTKKHFGVWHLGR